MIFLADYQSLDSLLLRGLLVMGLAAAAVLALVIACVKRWDWGRLSTNSSPPPEPQMYRIPCDCGSHITVSPGDAGVEFSCPHCGRKTKVPELSVLKKMPSR